jgi:signal transduction histidine kinase
MTLSSLVPPDPLEPLLEGLPCAAALFEGHGPLVAVNSAARACLAVDPRAPLAAQRWEVVLLPLGPAAVAAAARVAAGGTAVDVPAVDVTDADAAPGLAARAPWTALRVAHFPGGRVLVCATERGTAGATARAQGVVPSDALLATLLPALPVPAWVLDAAGRVVHRNPMAEAASPAPTVRALWELDAPHDPQRQRPLSFLDMPAMRALAGEAVRGAVLEVRRAQGGQRVAVHAHPVRDDLGAIAGAVLVEVPVGGDAAAQLERLVEERSRALLASQEAQLRDRRLAAVGQLAAGVMHDLNNVLNPIMAAAYLLRHHAESPAAVRDYAERIRTAAETGAAIASRVGRFIRQEPLHGGDTLLELGTLASEVLDFTAMARVEPAAGGTVQEERAFAPGVWVRGLPGEIREALVNLVQNGLDAMPAGGTLAVRTFADGTDACVAVRDTGVGISAEVRERAFEPFFTTKGMRGSGLGLAEVYGMARRHRGTATITSVPGRGTEVVVRLPLEAAPPAPAPAPSPAGAAGGRGAAGLRILVVEDQEDNRELLQRLLRADGHVVEAVGDCAGARARLAVAAAAPASAGYDLLLTDAGLPDGDGWALVREARTRLPALRAGVLTGWEREPEGEGAAGVAFVLRKPWRLADLQAHVAGPGCLVPDGG